MTSLCVLVFLCFMVSFCTIVLDQTTVLCDKYTYLNYVTSLTSVLGKAFLKNMSSGMFNSPSMSNLND